MVHQMESKEENELLWKKWDGIAIPDKELNKDKISNITKLDPDKVSKDVYDILK